jgi:hypothetical protein
MPASEEVIDDPFFVVGPGRSGTTMLRVMLGLHPRLAVPGESQFIPLLIRPRPDGTLRTPTEALEELVQFHRFLEWEFDPSLVRAEFALHGPAATLLDAVKAPYRAFARATGKVRWGDKTPGYAQHIPLLATAFPTSKFLLMVRDGREVADAFRDAHWGDGSIVTGALHWATLTQLARAAGSVLGPERFREVRYDRLVAAQEDELKDICAFLGEDYDPAMLDVAGAARSAFDRLPPHHHNLLKPMTPGLRDWQGKWSTEEKVAVEAVVGPVLDELGFPRSVPVPSPRKTKVVKARAEARRQAFVARRWLGWKARGAAQRVGLR